MQVIHRVRGIQYIKKGQTMIGPDSMNGPRGSLASFPGRKNERPGTHCTRFNAHARSINIQIGMRKHTRSKYTKAMKVCCL